MNSTKIVDNLLENTRLDALAGACKSIRHLYGLKQKAVDIFKHAIKALDYEHALEEVGLKPSDVDHRLYGNMIGATHNYKGTEPVRVCTDEYCRNGRLKMNLKPVHEQCPECGNATQPKDAAISPSGLKKDYAEHTMGVVTKDGRHVFFKKPLHPKPWIGIQMPEDDFRKAAEMPLSQVQQLIKRDTAPE